MKRIAGVLFLSFAVSLALGWMLATANFEINSADRLPSLADGNVPQPPPPYAFDNGVLVADGNVPQPPSPYAA